METPNVNFSFRKLIVITFLLFIVFLSNANSTVINITVQDFTFTPSHTSAFVGDTVRWTWLGARTHSTTCDGVFPGTSLPPGADAWSQILDSSIPVFSYVLTVEGTYEYVCIFHAPAMTGTIIAEALLPVELTDFVATTIKNEVILDWGTVGEINNEKFEIQRININSINELFPEDLPYVTVGELSGNGTSNQPHFYKFIDRNLKSGTYLYRLKQVDYNSNYIYHLLNDKIVIGIPNKFNLSQNYPNPFNPVTKINYEIPEDGFVKITLFDISGKMVSTVVSENVNAGYQTAEVNGSDLSSGAYFYKIDYKSNNYSGSFTKRMMLVK